MSNNHDNSETIFFGATSFRNQKIKFGIKQDDRRRHFYTIGKTGMGKSNLMENMAIQDIQKGHGIAFLDPHGEAAEGLLDYIPKERIKDVVFFNPSDLDFPIAFNVMEKVDFKYRHLVAGGLMAVFKKVWPDVWSARMEYILSNTILALLEYPDSTLLGVNRVLADPDYRAKVIAEVKDPTVKSFWVNEYSRYSQKYETEATAAIQNKVGQFVSNALIRNIIGQTQSTINMRKIMDEGKILILDLSKGRIGEDNSRLLGALLITKLQLAAMSRVDIPEKERKDFYLYVDEFQNFATESFASILSEARKYRLCLTVGHQYITQMDEVVRDAVFGNVGTMAVFRVGAEDAEFLEKEFSPEFTAEDLVNLAKYNIYLKLMIDGVASHPFSAGTLAPLPPLEESNRDAIIEASRGTYGVERELVEQRITEWTETASLSAPSASKPPAKNGAAPTRNVGFSNATSQVDPSTGQTQLYDAVCVSCGKPTKVIFPPDSGRPIYCKSCLKKIKSAAMPSPAPKINHEPQNHQPNHQPSQPPKANQPHQPPKEQSRPPQPHRPEPRHELVEKTERREPARIENVSFSSNRKTDQRHLQPQPAKRKEINLADLKKALEETLQHKKEEDEHVAATQKTEEKIEQAPNKEVATEREIPTAAKETKPEPQLAPAAKENPITTKDSQHNHAKQDTKEKKGVIQPGQKVEL